MSDTPDPQKPGVPAERPAGATPPPGEAGGTSAAPGQASGESAGETALRDVVDPADVRRAPRYGRFLGTGVVVGLVVSLVVGVIFLQTPEAEAMLKPGVYVAVITAFVVTFTTLAAGLIAILADRRSVRRYERARSAH